MAEKEVFTVKVDPEVADEFREFVVDKHGTTYGKLGDEVERALQEYMDRDRYARIEANLRKVMESLNVDEATEEEMRAYGITSKNKSEKEGSQEENRRESELSEESKLDDESNESTTDGMGTYETRLPLEAVTPATDPRDIARGSGTPISEWAADSFQARTSTGKFLRVTAVAEWLERNFAHAEVLPQKLISTAIRAVHGDVAPQTEKNYLKGVVHMLGLQKKRGEGDRWTKTQRWFSDEELR